MKTVLVAGAGGFIGGYLVRALLDRKDCYVRAVSSRPVDKWLQVHECLNEGGIDLRKKEACDYVVSGVDEVYNLAAKVGGIGYIENHKVDCALSSLINTHLLMAAQHFGVKKYFYASSACVYPNREGPICENHSEPAQPSEGYGWEKMFSERLCQYYWEEFGLKTQVARYFTTYGPGDSVKGAEGKHHVPSALCEKVALAKLHGLDEIEIWGDGHQRRNFLFVKDAAEGSIRLMDQEVHNGFPVNLGGTEVVSIGQLLGIIEEIAGTNLKRRYKANAAMGVRTRSSDNTLCKYLLGWEPSTPLFEGMKLTYESIYARLAAA